MMFLNWKIKQAKKKLDRYVAKYGLNDSRTKEVSNKANELINKHYSTEK